MRQRTLLSMCRSGNLIGLWRLLGLAGIAMGASWVALLWLSPHPAMVLILILWVGALTTVVLPIRLQLFLFWALLPFISLLKRLVFLDQSAGTTHMYLVLAAPDIILGVILLKLLLRALDSRVRTHLLAVDIAVSLFGAYSLLSALFLSSKAPFVTRLAAVESYVWPTVMYYVAAHHLSRWRDANALAGLVTGSAVLVSLYGIQQFFGGLLPFEEAWLARATTSISAFHVRFNIEAFGVFRTFATLDSSGTYGIFLGMGLVLAWARRFRLGIPLWLGTSFLLTLGLILSFHRFTWAVPAIAATFILLFSYRRIRPLFSLQKLHQASSVLLTIIFSFVVFYAGVSKLAGTSLVTTTNPYLKRALTTSTLFARVRWTTELSKLSLLGQGLASEGGIAGKFGGGTRDVYLHNLFADILESMGVIGVGFFLWLFYLLVKRIIATLRLQREPTKRRVFIALFSLVLAMLIASGLANGPVFYFGRAIPYYFWAFCGILTHYDRAYLHWPEANATRSWHCQSSA